MFLCILKSIIGVLASKLLTKLKFNNYQHNATRDMNELVIADKFIAQGFFFLIGNKLAVKRTRETIQYRELYRYEPMGRETPSRLSPLKRL